ncbi:MAG: glycosyl hydrolase family 95 catalytic domain-containing protein [Fermentimonas sp.]|jgi:alpha-L-fucosidase 2
MRIRILILCLCSFLLFVRCQNTDVDLGVEPSREDLVFTSLAKSWDEGMPLGNANVGALIWQKGDALRFSLDRTDLWDLRPSDSLSGDNYRFSWVKEHIRNKDYLPVQQKFDHPYDREPAPSKIPGAALEFPLTNIGEPESVRLYLDNALCEMIWENGINLQTFVHATEPIGWFVFSNLNEDIEPIIVPPVYNNKTDDGNLNPVTGQDLRRLGYEQGDVVKKGNRLTYHQDGYGGFYYDVVVEWKRSGNKLYGVWSVSSSLSEDKASEKVEDAIRRGVKTDYREHMNYWNKFWSQSSVLLPDTVLQKQYRNEMYKFGSASRENSYPISLQSVWTADNGKLPPWKGDYHHDLNTQLSYWPAYIGNHLSEGLGYLNTLWSQRDTYKRYTREYFEAEGMNIPGVCTLVGEPMGGWIQYAMGQTIGAWLAQHFYLHWKYSADEEFLRDRAYPFIKDVAIYMEQISEVDENGVRKLEYSSSPEIYDNSLQAWFPDMANFDLALMHFIFKVASETAGALGFTDEEKHWKGLEEQLPFYDLDEQGALTFSKGHPYNSSHRHFSHALAIHPLGLIDWSDGEESQRIIKSTLEKIEDYGPDYWTGYSYTWYSNMKARAFDGNAAADALRIFAENFCLQNTFHANGDQSGTGKSKFTYRPFTLEGNFAFASGVQEMLLQSHTGIIRVFPAIPDSWKNVSFEKLRAVGAFLISAEKKDGQVTRVSIYPEKGGALKIVSPFGNKKAVISGDVKNVSDEDGLITIETYKGKSIILECRLKL